MLTEEEKDRIYEGVWLGTITIMNLPSSLYDDTALILQSDVYKGYGTTLNNTAFGSTTYNTLNSLRENVNHFSAAKTFQQIKESQALILDSSGKIRPFNEYVIDAKKVDGIFNETWLKTERDTAITQSQNSNQWGQIENDKELFPYLKYHTQKDERVRHSHRALDGFTAPVNDPYWSSIAPQNDYRCRCRVEQLSSGKRSSKQWERERVKDYNRDVRKFNRKTKGKKDDIIKSLTDIPEGGFKGNVGKDGFIFKANGLDKHPYFKIPPALQYYQGLNYGMDINLGL